jgi:hypothetical protein
MIVHSLMNVVVPAVVALQDADSSGGGGGGPDEGQIAAIIAAVGGILCCSILIVYAILAVICWLVSSAQKKVPPEHRLMSPGAVWLLLIPLFNYVWAFFVFTRVPRSLAAALQARGIASTDDCGQRWGLVFAILHACSLVGGFMPFIGPLVGLAALVFLILALVSIRSAAAKLPA